MTSDEVSEHTPQQKQTAAKPSLRTDLLIATSGQVLGNLLTAIVIYLILVAGSVIKGSMAIIVTIIVSLILTMVVAALLGIVLWARGSFSNNYNDSVHGRRVVYSSATLIILPAVFGLLVLLYFAIQATE